MGDADLVKPMLEKLGTVHFGRLNMKPGKPTTFATLARTADGSSPQGKVLFFGLPGNPVSCLVTKSLLIDPALKKLQGKCSEKLIVIIFIAHVARLFLVLRTSFGDSHIVQYPTFTSSTSQVWAQLM